MRPLAEQWLRERLGSTARFHEGQWEAIEALVQKRQRVLVVQRTGWGKSLVYFMATRLLRSQGAGTTILISPLLSLMRNQVQAANQWGLSAETLNSSNAEEHPRIEAALLAGQIDLLLISPERLANDAFKRDVWSKLKKQVGLLVIDEAHCISDWGHDFRPNYRRIMALLDDLPKGTPVLATTATANDRVVADVSEIIGVGMNIQRGALTRDSLHLYVYPDGMDHPTRLTLLSHLMQHIPGSGIIYCTTTNDCRQVAEWLQSEGYNVKPYYADVEDESDESRVDLENQLLHNKVKALVSSVALGMGFDKPDLHFVIHYQLPGNIISYYQQIGRAGRGIERAHIVLMHGYGDEDIQNYFIETAFPKPGDVAAVVDALKKHKTLTRAQLQQHANVRFTVLEKILTHLEVEKIVDKVGASYRAIKTDAAPDYARWQSVTENRRHELAQMRAYVQHEGCLMRFIADALDDPSNSQPCGKCKNCKRSQSKFTPNPQDIARASRFLRKGNPLVIEPRKQLIRGLPGVTRAKDLYVNATGIALCSYYDAGWGEQVRAGRYQLNHYSDELVQESAALLRGQWKDADDDPPEWVTAVPSLRRPKLVPDFAQRLAKALSLPYVPVLEHITQHPEQKTMQNSFQRASNVIDKFDVIDTPPSSPVLLVDDLVDTRWTLTIIGDLLQRAGSGDVYPFALASMGFGDG
ncbi:MAG: RecQ family ATP-dependent DNA helicase [Anaerolineae bacterium]